MSEFVTGVITTQSNQVADDVIRDFGNTFSSTPGFFDISLFKGEYSVNFEVLELELGEIYHWLISIIKRWGVSITITHGSISVLALNEKVGE